MQAKRENTTSAARLSPGVKGRSKLTIESGGLLNATYGHCCIDDIDRLASQEESLISVLQSRLSCLTLSSLCTNIHTPTSIIATANTISGHYDQSKLLTENVRISPSLLREFHLVFVMQDKPNKEMDTSLTEHVKALHAGRKKNASIATKFEHKPKTNNSMNMSIDDNLIDLTDDDNYNLGLRLKLNPIEEVEMDLIPTLLIKKFIGNIRIIVNILFKTSNEIILFYKHIPDNKLNPY